MRLMAAAISCVLWAGGAEAAGPKGLLSVSWTVQQKEDGALNDALHVYKLQCWKADCELVVLTLNQCLGSTSYPQVEVSSTADGSLVVEQSGSVVTVKDTSAADSYSAIHRLTLDKDGRLKGYSGGFTKDSKIAGKVLTVSYVPLIASAGWATKQPKCGFSLPTVVAEPSGKE